MNVHMKKYEIIEHTADVGIRAYGKDPNEIIAHMAEGMFSLITDLSRVKVDTKQEIRVKGMDYDDLVFAFLSELLFLHDTYGLVFSKFDVKIERAGNNELILSASVHGTKIGNNAKKLLIKGVTYHMLEIKPEEGFGTVIFDV